MESNLYFIKGCVRCILGVNQQTAPKFHEPFLAQKTTAQWNCKLNRYLMRPYVAVSLCGGVILTQMEHSSVKYLNNIVESDHRSVKRRTRPMMGFQSFHTANRILKGIEAMIMMIKQQTYFLQLSIQDQVKFVNKLFGIYA